MKDLFKISVVIPTYNRKSLLKNAIDSVLKQKYSPKEIIIIDDGSDDGTEKLICREYPQIKYVWQDNSGISSARNLGIEQSTGDWIAFLDSDDEWLPNKLENQVYELNNYPDYQICHTNEIWIRNGRRVNQKEKHQKFGGYIFEKCLPLCAISPSSVLIHKKVFDKYGLFDTSLPACEDYDMWLRICAFLPVLYIEKPLIYKYGGHPDQLSRKHWGMDRFRISALEKIVNNPDIEKDNRIVAQKMLIKKLEIFINGAQKRAKTKSDITEYIKKLKHYKTCR